MKKSEIAILSAAAKTEPTAESEIRVLRSFYSTHREMVSDYLVIADIWWDRNFEGMTAYLRKLGIRQFVVANSSSELMELLVYLTSNGYRVAGPATYSRKYDDASDPARIGPGLGLAKRAGPGHGEGQDAAGVDPAACRLG